MIVDVHTHFFRPELDFGPTLRADMARCAVDPASWGNVAERHLETTRDADITVVFGLQAMPRTGTFPTTRSLRTWQFYNSIRLLVEYRADHKVLFGSDFPFNRPARA